MERWLKSEPLNLNFTPEQIDEENGIIHDIVMAQVGPAKGHGVWLEQEFIDRLVEYDLKHHNENGLKARFGHPAMSDTTMGKQMGYFKNFRVRGSQAVADLHLLKSADLSPSMPGMREWMLSMAQEAKDFVMSSIVFKAYTYYQYNPEDKERVKLELNRFEEPIAKYGGERVYVGFDEANGDRHKYTDIVESGAATEALFSQQFNQDKFAVRVVSFLQENADILSFIQANPHKIVEMCETLNIPIEMGTKKEKLSLRQRLEALLFAETEETEKTVEVVETETEVEETTDTPETEEMAQETVSDTQYDQVLAQMRELQQMNADLTAKIEALEAKPLAKPTSYEEETGTGDDGEAFICPTTAKAMGR